MDDDSCNGKLEELEEHIETMSGRKKVTSSMWRTSSSLQNR